MEDPVRRVFVDPEIAGEGFTYVLNFGREGTVHIEQVLEYTEDPSYVRDRLLYRLTLEAQKRIDKSPLSKREIIRRLGTSPAQLYRLLDQTNYRKSVDQLVSLLRILDCDVDFVVRGTTASSVPWRPALVLRVAVHDQLEPRHRTLVAPRDRQGQAG